MKKRFFALLLAITLLGSACDAMQEQIKIPENTTNMIPVITTPATEAPTEPTAPEETLPAESTVVAPTGDYIKIAGVSIGFKEGEYFSKNRKNGCKTSAYSNGTCHEHSICKPDSPSCLCIGNVNQVDPALGDVPLGSVQCLGFARYCQWVLFGDYATGENYESKGFTDLSGKVPEAACTQEKLKSLYHNAPAGTHIRIGGHSIVVMAADENGMTYVDANFSGITDPCIIKVRYRNWEELKALVDHCGDIEYSVVKAQTVKRVYDGSDFIEYVYDAFGNLREEHHCDYHGHREMSYWYDETGKYTSGRKYDQMTALDRYEYDEEGRLEVHTELYASGKEGKSTLYVYDEKGDLSETKTKAGTLKYATDKTYQIERDSENRIISEKCNSTGIGNPLMYYYTYTYDAQGQLIRKQSEKNGSFTTYEYDTNGNLICQVDNQASGKYWRYTYTYNENNDMLTYTVQQSDSLPQLKVEKEYDARGRVIKHTEYFTGNVFSEVIVTTYEYDSKSNVSKMVITGYNGNVINDQHICYYTYDANGRLTKWNNEQNSYYNYAEIDLTPYYN